MNKENCSGDIIKIRDEVQIITSNIFKNVFWSGAETTIFLDLEKNLINVELIDFPYTNKQKFRVLKKESFKYDFNMRNKLQIKHDLIQILELYIYENYS